MTYFVERNGQQFGPYEPAALATYVGTGQILLQDIAIDTVSGSATTVRAVLKAAGLRAGIKSHGNIFGQIKAFGWGLLLPKSSFQYKTFRKDQKLLLVSIIGLAPAFLIKFTGATVFTFYAIALYFSLIWGMFFHSVFKTPQVKVKTTIALFFITQAIIFLAVDVLRLTTINPLYRLTESGSFIPRLVGFVAGVGVFEEAIKALPVFFICYRAKGPVLPQTAVFYGLISGIGFGVFEGVGYQLSVNMQLDYGSSFFLNIARLTSLPFLHAIWAGIAGYFISLSVLYPKSRQPLWVLAIAIPALLHGLYDTLGWSIPGLAISYVGVALLIIYLQKAKDFGGRMLP